MPYVIRCHQLHRSFDSPGRRVEVLKGVDLELTAGESAAVLGPSGSGKSTLLHLLGGLDRPTGGEIWWGTFPVHEHPPSRLAARRAECVGLIYQHHYLLSDLTLLENVTLPSRIIGRPDEERARELLERVGVSHRAHAPPSRVSGGERQRAAVARALALKPRLLLADEPTGSLDARLAGDVFDLLLSLAHEEGAAVLLVTHDEQLVASRNVPVFRLEDGQLTRSAPSTLPSAHPH